MRVENDGEKGGAGEGEITAVMEQEYHEEKTAQSRTEVMAV